MVTESNFFKDKEKENIKITLRKTDPTKNNTA